MQFQEGKQEIPLLADVDLAVDATPAGFTFSPLRGEKRREGETGVEFKNPFRRHSGQANAVSATRNPEVLVFKPAVKVQG